MQKLLILLAAIAMTMSIEAKTLVAYFSATGTTSVGRQEWKV